MSIHIEVHRIGKDECSLTRKTAPGLEVTIEGEARCFLSWSGLKQLLNWKLRDAEGPVERLDVR